MRERGENFKKSKFVFFLSFLGENVRLARREMSMASHYVRCIHVHVFANLVFFFICT